MLSIFAAMAPLLAHLLMLAQPSPQGLWSSTEAGIAPSGSVAERRMKAHEHFERGRFLEAAQEFETLARAGRPTATADQFNSAAARRALHHFSHAAAHLEQVLADPTLLPAQRAQAQSLLAQAYRELRSIAVNVQIPRDVEAIVVRAEFLPVYASDRRPILEQPLMRDPGARLRRKAVMRLDPGAWQLRIDDPRFAAEVQRVVLSAEAVKPIAWVLRPRQDPRRVRRFAAGVAGMGGLVAVTGLGLIVGGQMRWSQTLGRSVESCGDSYPLELCHSALARAGNLRIAGGAVLGAGLGVVVAGLTTLARDPRRRKGGWIAELVLGAASMAGGVLVARRGDAAFAAVHTTSVEAQLAWSDPSYLDGSQRGARQALLGAAWAGLGGGLVLGAVTGLLADRSGRFQIRDSANKLSVGVSTSTRQAGLVVSGAF